MAVAHKIAKDHNMINITSIKLCNHRLERLKINPEKIRDIIGKGGATIRKIQEETGTEINVEDGEDGWFLAVVTPPSVKEDEVIPRDVTVSESPSHGLPVIDYAPRARGARAYIELCMEVLERE